MHRLRLGFKSETGATFHICKKSKQESKHVSALLYAYMHEGEPGLSLIENPDLKLGSNLQFA